MLGQLLDVRYKLIEVLGGGGFSQTYVAEDTRRPGNPKCVVKHLKPAVTDPSFLETARRLFKTEAETLEQLGNHDQIPRLLAYFEENQEFYLVQELIQGHVLGVELPPGRRWTETQVVQLLQEVLGILDFVHSNGVIHRDIKPNNIIRRQQDNKLVLVDFGTVKQVKVHLDTAQSQMSASVAIGTVGYMPTEQVRGKPRQSSDIYALGIIGIQALTGLIPSELLEDAEGEIRWQDQVPVSTPLAAVLTKMVRYHFKDRYQSAAEALEALQFLGPNPLVQVATPPGYAPTQVVTPPGYTPTQPATHYGSAPMQSAASPTPSAPPTGSFQVSPSGQQLSPNVPTNPSGQPGFSNSHLYPPGPQSGLQSGSQPKFIALLKSPVGVMLGIAALVSILAVFALHWNNQRGFQAALLEAKELAVAGKFVEAVDKAAQIPSSNSSYLEAQRLIDQSSDDILKQATDVYEESGDLAKAIELAGKIPKGSMFYQEAQTEIAQWQQQTETNKKYLKVARRSLDEGREQDAIKEANKITYTPFWKGQKDEIVEEAKSILEAEQPKKSPPSSASLNNPPAQPQPQANSPAQRQPQINPPAQTQPQFNLPQFNAPAQSQPQSQSSGKAATKPPAKTAPVKKKDPSPRTTPTPPPESTLDTCDDPNSFFCTESSGSQEEQSPYSY